MSKFWATCVWMWQGIRTYGKSGFEARQAQWAVENEDAGFDESAKGKTMIVTGANSGLGLAAATALARHGARVHLVCRNAERGQAVLKSLLDEGCNVALHLVDLARPQAIREFVCQFVQSQEPLDVLVNNAGVMINERRETEDGLEMTYATNTIGTFLLTGLLMPLLQQTASKTGRPSRVIVVSSGGMYTQRMNANDLQFRQSKYEGTQAYAQTKRTQSILCEMWAKKHADSGVHFYCMHPGWADTPGVQTSMPTFYKWTKGMLRSNEQGADTIVWLALSQKQEVIKASGLFYFDRQVVSPHLPNGGTEPTEDDCVKLWQACVADSGFNEAADENPAEVAKLSSDEQQT